MPVTSTKKRSSNYKPQHVSFNQKNHRINIFSRIKTPVNHLWLRLIDVCTQERNRRNYPDLRKRWTYATSKSKTTSSFTSQQSQLSVYTYYFGGRKKRRVLWTLIRVFIFNIEGGSDEWWEMLYKIMLIVSWTGMLVNKFSASKDSMNTSWALLELSI